MSFQIENSVLIKYIEEPDETRVVIPAGVTSIGNSAFKECDALTEVVFPDGMTEIGDEAFSDCGALTTFVLPTGVTRIGESAFASCRDLTKVVFPDSVTEIGDDAFYGCDHLANIVISDSIENISWKTFFGCDNLTRAVIRVHAGSLCIEEDAFDSDCTVEIHADTLGAYMRCDIRCDHILYLNGEAVTNVVLPSGLTSIPDGAFKHCVGLKSIVIPDGVTSIGGEAFEGCTGLTEIVIPNGVTNIEHNTFSGCIGLKSLTVPDSVTYFWESLKDCDDVSVHISFPGLCALRVSGDLWEHSIEVSGEEDSLEAYCAALDQSFRKLSKETLRNIEEKLLLSPRCAAAKYFESHRRFGEYAKAHKTDEDTMRTVLMYGPDTDAAKTKLCTAFLFRAFLQKINCPAQKWKSTYPVNHAMTAAARLLVWQQGNTTFTLDAAGVPVDVLGEPAELTGADIFLAHPMEMRKDTVTAWRDYITARHITQPFAQMWEPVLDPGEIRPERYRHRPIDWALMENREKHGIICRDTGTEPPRKTMLLGHEVELPLSLITCTGGKMAELADCEAYQSYEEKSQLISFGYFRFETYTRQVNHIVAFLDRCTVRDRILKDDIPARWCLDELSLPKILELIDLAARNRCVNAAAALQQYKLERFGDGAPGEVLDPLP